MIRLRIRHSTLDTGFPEDAKTCSFRTWDIGRPTTFVAYGIINVLLILLIICDMCSCLSLVPCVIGILILRAFSFTLFLSAVIILICNFSGNEFYS